MTIPLVRSAFLLALAAMRGAEAMTAEKIKTICDGLPNRTIVIGMVTKGNVELTLERWRPTFEDYLTAELQALGYGCRTRLVPLGFDDYEEQTASASIDVIFPNPTAFQEMKDRYGVHEFLSVTRKFGDNQRLDRFGGVIVRSSSRFQDVVEISDIKKYPGMKVCAVNANAFGGWHIQWYEMIKHGIDASADVVLNFTGKHELAIELTVVSKECDIGVARTETIERLIGQGVFNDSDVFTLSEKGPANDFPQHLSTELYPEWPLASLNHLPRELEQIIAVPLLTIKPDSYEATVGDFYGFSFPYSYQPVKDMFIAIDKEGTGLCYEGHFRQGSNPGTCEPCPAGTFSASGVGACTACPVGTINNGTANVGCAFCAQGLTTEREGSVEGECIEEAEVSWGAIVISMSSVLALLILALGAVAARRLYRRYQDALRASLEEEEGKRKRLRSTVNIMQNFEFPLCVMRFADFVGEERLVNHEDARDRGLLKFLDRWDKATAFAETNTIVFNSHQWLAIDAPDPHHTHYRSMCAASVELCKEYGWKHEELWIWVDYSSIPQDCETSKLCAIRSIMVYAACCKFFVAVAPRAVHVSRGHQCDELTYRRRGWCRLEQWAFMINGSVDSMFVYDGSCQLLNVQEKSGWFEDMIDVLDGDFSVESDKHMLVDVILGLYGFALICGGGAARREVVVERVATGSATMVSRVGTGSGNMVESVATCRTCRSSASLAAQYRDIAFPAKYFGGLNDRLEREVEKVFERESEKETDILWSEEELAKLMEASETFGQIHRPLEKRRLQADVVFAATPDEALALEQPAASPFMEHPFSLKSAGRWNSLFAVVGTCCNFASCAPVLEGLVGGGAAKPSGWGRPLGGKEHFVQLRITNKNTDASRSEETSRSGSRADDVV